tara:strand:+ start:2426 stop:3535 length:1110 start_codon:yes stop_codon:yes gene_type:complete
MSGNPNMNENFGKSYLQNGKFGKKGRKAIKSQGFANVSDFLSQAGVSNRLPKASQQSVFQNTLQKGYQAPEQATDDNTQGQVPDQGDPVPAQNPSVPQGLIQSGTDLQNKGADILNNGNPASDPLLAAGNNYQTGAQQDLGKVDSLAGAARAQGQNILNTLSQQQGAADQDIQNLFNAQPLDTLRSSLSQLNSVAQGSGRTNSRSGNEMNAELQRGLIRDQANARLGSNNQFRAQTVGELGTQRTTDAGLAGMYSGQGLGQGQLGNQALTAGGNMINDTNTTGANIYNQGFQNTLGGLGFINDAANSQYDRQNQIMQQYLANVQGANQNRKSQAYTDKMLQMQKDAAAGPGFMSGMLKGGIQAGLNNVV